MHVAVGSFALLGLAAIQGEFAFGVPQFQQLYHPVLYALAAGFGLTAIAIVTRRWWAPLIVAGVGLVIGAGDQFAEASASQPRSASLYVVAGVAVAARCARPGNREARALRRRVGHHRRHRRPRRRVVVEPGRTPGVERIAAPRSADLRAHRRDRGCDARASRSPQPSAGSRSRSRCPRSRSRQRRARVSRDPAAAPGHGRPREDRRRACVVRHDERPRDGHAGRRGAGRALVPGTRLAGRRSHQLGHGADG